VFDALSANNMSVYGYQRETTPNIARFADNASVFHAHLAGGNHTSPGVASILTGTYPWSHRALHLHGTADVLFADRNLFSELTKLGYHTLAYSHNLLVTSLLHQCAEHLNVFPRTRQLCLVDDQLADRLFSRDYNAAFWSEWLLLREGQSPPSSLILSLLQRMVRFAHRKGVEDTYGYLFPRGLPHLHSLFFVLEDAVDWIADQVAGSPQPFAAYFHLLPPHEPYTTRREFVDLFDDGWTPLAKNPHHFSEGHTQEFLNQQRREYDEFIAYADAEFGRLCSLLSARGALENTYVILTSDHGEMFERGIRGHVTPVLYDPVIHVPLLIAGPAQMQRNDIVTPTSAVDLLPTILHIAGQTIPSWCEGRVLPSIGNHGDEEERSVFAVEAKGNPKQAPLTKVTAALVKDRYKLIGYTGYKSYETEFELYDMDNDPEELENLYSVNRVLAADLQRELLTKLQEVDQPYAGS
jgi:arylsulfatase A-like enzyme